MISRESRAPIHIGAWLTWLFAAMLGALLTRNPIYMLIVIVAGVLVRRAVEKSRTDSGAMLHAQDARQQQSRGLLFRAVLLMLVFVTLFKGFSLHLGTTVLFRLPEEWPLVGGPITGEGLLYSTQDAASLITVLAVFAAFSAGADYYALLRSVPAFMHQVGLITSIAITFVPQTVTRYTEIREAQALRGHRVKKLRDLLPVIIPLLSGGMERAMNLAEAMEARGFSRKPANSHKLPPLLVQTGILGGLMLILTGAAFLAFFAGIPVAGWGTIALGFGLICLTIVLVNRGSKQTRYRRSTWREKDTLLAAPAVAVVAILLIYKVVYPSALVYDPLSRLRLYWPPFDPVLALALAALAAPILLFKGAIRQRRDVAQIESALEEAV